MSTSTDSSSTSTSTVTPATAAAIGRGWRRILAAGVAAAVAAVALGAAQPSPSSAEVVDGERAIFVPITPCRLMDTRAGEAVGARSTPLGPEETHSVTVRGASGNCRLPTDVVGVVMNVAVVNPTASSFLTVFPADAPRPLAASANWVAGEPPVSNAVTADVSAAGSISFYNLAGTVDLAVDVVGYHAHHTHDDRYDTRAQVDAKLSSKADLSAVYARAEVDRRTFKWAGAVVCGPNAYVSSQVNNLQGSTVSVTWSASLELCVIEFGVSVAARAILATPNAAKYGAGPIGAQCVLYSSTAIGCQRFVTTSGAISGGNLWVEVL